MEVLAKEFTEKAKIDYFYCDQNGDLKLSYLLKLNQKISMDHCDALGAGTDYMASIHKAFLLAKLNITLHKMPRLGQTIVMKTRPSQPVRAQYRRLTLFFDERENLLAQIDSRWFLVDTQTKHIVRRQPEELSHLQFPPVSSLEDWKIPKAGAALQQEKITVRLSHLDTNGHMNNTEYGDLLCNCLEEQLLAGRKIHRLLLFYHHEAKLGDELRLMAEEREDSTLVFGLLGEDSVCFESQVFWG